VRQELNLFKNFGFEIVNYFYIVTNTKKKYTARKVWSRTLNIKNIPLYCQAEGWFISIS